MSNNNLAEDFFGKPAEPAGDKTVFVRENLTEKIFTSRPDPSVVGEPPPVPDMIRNLYHDTAKWAKTGFQTSSPDEVDRRLKICGECEFFKGGRCMICGCFMNLKAKLATGSCPKGKW